MLWYIFYRIWDRTSGIWGQGKIWTTTPPWWQAVSSVLIMAINLTDKKKWNLILFTIKGRVASIAMVCHCFVYSNHILMSSVIFY